MALNVGDRLGPYEIVSAIGAGGMGEVYRARDTRLDRIVAIKVLPSQFAVDPAFRERFDREARVISQLDHPHICPLYDVGEEHGTSFLVMQYLEGETLEQRLAKGPLPIDHALHHGVDITAALDKAHRAGIVHRDLKPGNVILVKSGTRHGMPETKLLDFGLAKSPAAAVGPSVAGPSMLPTTPPNLTAQGTILGTFQYMAPEQLEGQEADARTDIFAFGALLYEMVTGRKAFEGKTQASLIAAILDRDPAPISTLQSLAPPALDRIVSKCLAKDPDARWQSARDLRDELEWVANSTGAGDTRVQADHLAAKQKRSTRERLAWTAAAILFAAVAALLVPAIQYLRLAAPDAPITRFEVATPPTLDPMSFALSPDGRQLVFVATSDNVSRLWLRPLDQVKAQPLSGTEDASYPFWSPDSRSIGFFAGGKLKRIDLAAGAPQVLADASNGRGGTWNRDGVIVFAPSLIGPLMRVSATGGSATPVTRVVAGQSSHRWPQFLPDGQRILFLVTVGSPETRGTYVATLNGGEPRLLTDDMAAVFAPPGWLLLVNQDTLVARRFDVARGIVESEAVALAQGVGDNGVLRGSFSIAGGGVLAHRAGAGQRRQFVWVDRTGRIFGTVTPADSDASQGSAELSPDGRRLATQRQVQGNIDVWLVDVSRGVFTRFTFDPNVETFPVWSSDASRVVFQSTRSHAAELFEKPSTGSGAERVLLTSDENKVPLDSSPDGRFLLYAAINPKTGPDLMALPLTGDHKPFPVVQTSFEEAAGQFSPDGRFVAYESNESGRFEIYVRGFPQSAGQWQMSTEGGTQVRWRRDGKELFYVAPDGRLMAVPVKVGGNNQLDAGAPVALFMTRLARGANAPIAGGLQRAQYAVAADGRFLMNVSVDEATVSPITIVLNWDAQLRK